MQNGDIKLYRKFIETMKLLNVYLGHFPKHEKYALCNRIKNSAYAVYDLIVEGQKRYHKKTTLTELDIAHEQLRMQLFLAYELGYFRFQDGKRLGVRMKLYFLNLLIGLDQFVNVVFGGAPDRTISYRAWQHRDHWSGSASVKLIDGIFSLFGQQDHCRTVFEGGDNQTTEVLG